MLHHRRTATPQAAESGGRWEARPEGMGRAGCAAGVLLEEQSVRPLTPPRTALNDAFMPGSSGLAWIAVAMVFAIAHVFVAVHDWIVEFIVNLRSR